MMGKQKVDPKADTQEAGWRVGELYLAKAEHQNIKSSNQSARTIQNPPKKPQNKQK